MSKDKSREQRVSIENDPDLSDEEKLERLTEIDQPEPESEIGKTIEGGASILASILTAGALDALPGEDDEDE